jgi:hypothetical protein
LRKDDERVFGRAWWPDRDGKEHAVLAVLPATGQPSPTIIDRFACGPPL